MDWGDRRNFLNSVGPTRIAAVCSALLWLKSTYELVRLWYVYLSVDPLEGWPNIVMLGLALVVLFQGLVALYGCWLDWKYAERLREVAGGETACMAHWSQLHLRTAWLYAAVGVLGLVSEIGQWIVDKALAQRLFPV